MAYVNLNVRVDEYTRRVLGVIKEKYGLRDVGQAIDKFVGVFGREFVELQSDGVVVRELTGEGYRNVVLPIKKVENPLEAMVVSAKPRKFDAVRMVREARER